jgi:hypothetical protein
VLLRPRAWGESEVCGVRRWFSLVRQDIYIIELRFRCVSEW